MVPFLLTGCTDRTRVANVELRKKVQALESQIEHLKLRREADAATIRALEQQRGTLPTLPQERLDQLVTVHGLKLNRLTSADSGGVKVYATPIDADRQDLKATGSFIVEAFDAGQSDSAPLGRWEFNLEASRKAWLGDLMMYDYVLTCPWQAPPAAASIRVRVTFTDALTHREFAVEKVVERRQG